MAKIASEWGDRRSHETSDGSKNLLPKARK
jgi:hypothetical protein